MLVGESGAATHIEGAECVTLCDDSAGTWGLVSGQGATEQPWLLEAISRTPWAWRAPSDTLPLLDKTLAAIAHVNPLAVEARGSVTLARLEEDLLEIAHYGEVPAVLLSDQPVRLTEPHTLFREQVRMGLRSADDPDSKQHDIVTRLVGSERGRAADVAHHQIEPGDTLILCTRSVCGDLDRGPLKLADLANLAAGRHPQDAADAIVDEAVARGARGTASALVVRFD